MKLKDIPPDYAARKVLIAAYIYYVLDDNIMSDQRYDRLSGYVSRHWDELKADRRWCMINPDDTASSGMHFRFPASVVAAALNYFKYKTGRMLEFPNDGWKTAQKGSRAGMKYTTTAGPRPRSINATSLARQGTPVENDRERVLGSTRVQRYLSNRRHGG